MNKTNVSKTAREIAEEFNLGECLSQKPIGRSGRGIVALTTDAGRFVLKPAKNHAMSALYSEVERVLNADGVRQARIFRTPDGSLISTSGYSVYEFVEGTTGDCLSMTAARLGSAMGYMAVYNASLARLDTPAAVTALDDPWNQAASLRYVVDELPERIDDLNLGSSTRAILARCIAFLRERRESVDKGIQLVHGDIGPDNILFAGEDVVTIIDFSPHCASELYSLCQFFYWQFLWGKDVESAADDIRESLEIYCQMKPGFSIADGDSHAMLVFAAGYRLLGPLLAMRAGIATYSGAAIQARADLLERLIDSDSYGFSAGS